MPFRRLTLSLKIARLAMRQLACDRLRVSLNSAHLFLSVVSAQILVRSTNSDLAVVGHEVLDMGTGLR